MAKQKYHFETLQLHVGQEQADPATDARAVPIYQTTSYVFHDCQHAADRFALKDAGNVYGRLTSSTQAVLEERVAALEGGVAGLAVASGAAAVTYAITNIANAGDHVVASKTIYGGTYNLLAHTLSKFGITTTFVDPDDYEALEVAIKDNTKLVYIETLGNPNSNISDIERSADIAHRHSILLCMVVNFVLTFEDSFLNVSNLCPHRMPNDALHAITTECSIGCNSCWECSNLVSIRANVTR